MIGSAYECGRLQADRAAPDNLLSMFPSPPVSAPLSKDGFEALARGDYNSALKAFQKAADKGDAASLGNLAYLYETGKGVTQDYTKAIELYQRAAAAGCVPAEVSLAAMYESGRGIPRDYKKAALLLDKAATQGNARAQAG